MLNGFTRAKRTADLNSLLSTTNFVALFTTLPASDGTGAVEVATNGYARVQITSGMFGTPTSSTVNRPSRPTATYAQALTVVTVTQTAHGLISGQQVVVTNTTGTPATPTGTFDNIQVVDANTFRYTTSNSQTASGNITFNEVDDVLTVSNLLPITFPKAVGDLGTVVGWGITTASTGGTLQFVGNLTEPKAYTNNDTIALEAGATGIKIMSATTV